MQDIGFLGEADHIVKHNDFIQQINVLYSQYCYDDLAVTKELIVLLGNWLLHHVLKEDRRYSKWQKGENI